MKPELRPDADVLGATEEVRASYRLRLYKYALEPEDIALKRILIADAREFAAPRSV